MATTGFRRVLVPVEFFVIEMPDVTDAKSLRTREGQWIGVGPGTEEALRLAGRLCADGEVRLVHATPDLTKTAIYGGPEGTFFPIHDIERLDHAARDSSKYVLRQLAELYCPGVKVGFDVAAGDALDVILDAAEAHTPDAIVLSASGRGRLRRAFLGSTADKVIRRAPCPVLVVPTGAVLGSVTAAVRATA